MPLTAAPAREELIERLGLKPLPPDLLEEALTHASFLNEADAGTPSNERLEFLGDSVLGMVVANELFKRYPDSGEGDLTRMRADVVRGSTLARVAERFSLGDYMVLGRGEEAAGGRQRDRNLAGGLEALIGAVYQAQGYRSTRSFILRILGPELKQIAREGARIDPKSSLQHLVQAKWHEPPDYVTVDEESGGPGRRFVVEARVGGVTLGRGEGASKREAQQAAAREAVARLSAQGEV